MPMTPRLAILIPTIVGREHYYDRLIDQLNKQIKREGSEGVTILTNKDNGAKTTGAKRNELVQEAVNAGAMYAAFHDDDDLPGPTYINRNLQVHFSGCDCGELFGAIYFSGILGNPFHHSIDYVNWWQDRRGYYRTPNHISCVKTSIFAKHPFPDITIGEDGQQSAAMYPSIKSQYSIIDTIYHYFTGKRDTEEERKVVNSLLL